MEDTKKEIRNINCKGKMMINHYEFKENEEIENKKKINNMIKRKINSTGKINLIPNKRIIKMIEKQKTYKCLISLNQEKLKNLPINSNNSNKTTLNNNNLVHIGREHNDCIINSNKRINKKYVKRFSGMYDTKNNNNINKNFKIIIKNDLSKINEFKNNIKNEKYDFLNSGSRNYMINNEILNSNSQSIPKIIKATN
jgi:hypothetical protein